MELISINEETGKEEFEYSFNITFTSSVKLTSEQIDEQLSDFAARLQGFQTPKRSYHKGGKVKIQTQL